ncbi:potassium channel family protein [Cryobacterium sp. MLB-32]|uniref:potassium channel family protein n=1 Tax=Cryobacterium sp. MLB-32 TaxID=1529318 RepID=UPI0012E08C43|nr:potassium channel family protein [Cryobacterium sp. MLB-32]
MNDERWQKITQWPLTIAGVIFLITYTVHVLFDYHGHFAVLIVSIIVTAWLFLVVDYLVRFSLAADRGHWFRTHIFDLLAVLLPAVRPLRTLRLITLFPVFQRTTGEALRSRVSIYLAGSICLLLYLASLAVLQSERFAPGANIRTFGDALWWSVVTLGTVGYGDYYPVTTPGRLVAVALMAGGIASWV